MRLRYIVVTILFLLSIALSTKALGQVNSSMEHIYDRLSQMPSKTLIDRAENFLSTGDKADSALLCLTIVVHRYKSTMPTDEKIDIIGAYNGIWFIMFFTYFDYAKSFDALMKALEIAEDINYNQAQMYLNFGCFYQTLAEECKDDKLMRKAYSSYRKAFREGLKQGNSDELLNSFGNLTIVSARFHDLTNISSDWRLFQSTIQKHPKPLYLYTCYLYKGMLAKEKKQYDEALFWFRKQADITDDKDRIYIRNRIMMFLNIGEVLFLQHKYADAAAAVANGLRISRLLDIKDCKLQCYELMADYYAKAGNPSAAQQYKNQYYQLKDTLLNFRPKGDCPWRADAAA